MSIAVVFYVTYVPTSIDSTTHAMAAATISLSSLVQLKPLSPTRKTLITPTLLNSRVFLPSHKSFPGHGSSLLRIDDSIVRKIPMVVSDKAPVASLVATDKKVSNPIVVIDNYDSFTYNLCQYLGEQGCYFEVYRNDELTVDELKKKKPRGVLISPGPGTPQDSGISLQTVLELGPTVPLFGVCMGLQCMGEAFGGQSLINLVEHFDFLIEMKLLVFDLSDV
ncbi:Ankyrin repeat and SOCS box protein 2 [Sarracenia purpurea var. burkii]